MKKPLYLLLALLISWTASAAAAGSPTEDDFTEDSGNMFIFFNDSTSQGWVDGDEWTITFTNKDSLDQLHTFPIGINLENGVYSDTTHIALHTIDSILCQTPSPIVADNVYFLTEKHFPYIVETDSMSTLVFDTRGQEYFRLPTKGQKIYCDVAKHPLLPAGFMGKVEKIVRDEQHHRATFYCSDIFIEDIYDRYYHANVYQEDQDQTRKKTRAIGIESPLLSGEFKYKKEYKPGPLKIAFELTGKIEIKEETIIDKEKDLQKEKTTITASLTVDLPCGVSGSKTWNYEERLVESPTIYIKPYLGIKAALGLYATCTVTGEYVVNLSFPFSYSWIYERTGPFISFTSDNEQKKTLETKAEIAPVGTDKFTMSFEGEAGGFLDLGLDIRIGQANLRTYLGLGYQTKLEIDFSKVPIIGTDTPEKPNFEYRQKKYDMLSSMPSTSIDAILRFGLVFSQNKNTELKIEEDISDHPKVVFNLHNWVWAPTVSYEKVEQTYSKYKGRLHWYGSPLYDLETSCHLVDVSNYDDKSIKYITNDHPAPPIREKHYQGSYNTFDDLVQDFYVDLHDPKFHWAGKRWGVYPYYNDPKFGYVGPGKIGEFYIPYSIRADKPYVTHQGVTLRGSVDPRIKKDPTQKVLLYIISPLLTENGEDVFYIDKSTIGDNGQIEYYIPYNELPGKHKYYWRCWSTTEHEFNESAVYEFKGVEVEMPTTLEPNDVTENSARLTAQLCPSFFDNYLHKHVTYGFEYAEGGLIDLRPTTQQFVNKVSENERTNPYFYVEVNNLKANTYYNVRAFVITPDKKKVRDVNTVKFKTASPFLALNEQLDFYGAKITAELSYKINYSEESTVTFEIAEDKDFKHIVNTIVQSKPDWRTENDFDFYYWTTEGYSYDLKHSEPYYYRAILKQPGHGDIISAVHTFTLPNPYESRVVSATCEGNKGHFKGKVTNFMVKDVFAAPNDCAIYFEYSTHSNFANSEKARPKLDEKIKDSEGMSVVDVEVDVEGLEYNKKYYVRIGFIGFGVEEKTDAKTFRTPNPYGCTTVGSQVEDATVILRGKLDSYALEFFRNYPTDLVYTAFDITPQGLDINEDYVRVKSEHLDLSTGEFTAEVILDPSTTYFFRALVYGEGAAHPSSKVLSFTTMDYDPDLIPLALKKKIIKMKDFKAEK